MAGVNDFGLFVELSEMPVEGMIRVEDLGDDWYDFDARRQCLVGQRSGLCWSMGQSLEVVLAEVHSGRLEIRLLPTELGVAAFLPFSCERSVVRLDARKAAAKAERWRAIAKSAAMQSGQRAVPEVREPMALAQACELLAGATALLVCWEEAPQTAHIADALAYGMGKCGVADPVDARVGVVVGPEGGLTEREVDALLSCNPRASLVSLGPAVLRTETAGIVAPALVLHELSRMARKGEGR